MKMNCSGPIWLLLLFNQEGLPMHCIALSLYPFIFMIMLFNIVEDAWDGRSCWHGNNMM